MKRNRSAFLVSMTLVTASASIAVADAQREGLTLDVAGGVGPLYVRERGESINDVSGTRYSMGAGWFVTPRFAVAARFVTHDLYQETAPSTMDRYAFRFVSRSSIALGPEAQLWPWRGLAIAGGVEMSWFGSSNLRGKTARGIGGTLRAAYAIFEPTILGVDHAVQLRVESSLDRYAGGGVVIGSAILVGWQVL